MPAISPFGIRRAALIHATPERVWEEFTSLERMQAWFGTGHALTAYAPEIGAMVETRWDIDGVLHSGRGEVIVFDPPRELTFEHIWVGPDWRGREWLAPTKITILLTPAAQGTLVELYHHGFEVADDPAAFIAGYEDGWDTHHLEALRKLVEG